MKELIKPISPEVENELYEALCEKCDYVDIGCICKTKNGFADEDEAGIIF